MRGQKRREAARLAACVAFAALCVAGPAAADELNPFTTLTVVGEDELDVARARAICDAGGGSIVNTNSCTVDTTSTGTQSNSIGAGVTVTTGAGGAGGAGGSESGDGDSGDGGAGGDAGDIHHVGVVNLGTGNFGNFGGVNTVAVSAGIGSQATAQTLISFTLIDNQIQP